MAKRKTECRIPRKWYGILPGQDICFWVRVERLRKKRGITKRNVEGVKQCALDIFFGKVTMT